ncbi:hypothetical protein ACS0TY_006556 [Phlomoides rotata]
MLMTFFGPPSQGSAGQLGSGLLLSRPTDVLLFGGLFGVRSLLLTSCPLLASLVLLSASFVCLPLRLWTISLLSVCLLDRRLESLLAGSLAVFGESVLSLRSGLFGTPISGYPWSPLSETGPHWYKANVDGSVSSALGWFCTRIGCGYPLEAELVAILHSIIYSHSQGWLFLWVESDSSLAVDMVQKKIPLISWRL